MGGGGGGGRGENEREREEKENACWPASLLGARFHGNAGSSM